jgi:molecular chaperone Hsp33
MPLTSDFVLPFQLEKAPIRGRIVRLQSTVEEIIGRHHYPPIVNQLLAELTSLTVALASFFKFEGIFTLQISGDGPVRLMVVDVTHDGKIRACARFDEDQVAQLPASPSSLYPVLGTGYLAFTIDQADSDDRYQGIVELSGTTLAGCLHHFFRQSDQLETGIVVFARADPTVITPDHLAGTLMIQRMPAADNPSFEEIDEQNDAWLHSLSILGTTTAKELLASDLTAEDLLLRLFWEDGVRVFEKRPLIAQCRCSEGRIKEMLQTFSPSDQEAMIKDGEIKVTCEFCSQTYTFAPETLA